MNSLGSNYQALVLGASGTLGHAFASWLHQDPACSRLIEVSRSTHPSFDLEHCEHLEQLAQQLQPLGPFHLIIDATGALTIHGQGPEKHLGAVHPAPLQQAMQINAIGPMMLLKHLAPLLEPKGRSIYAKLSARVGSISDNHKGGWYGYRASKAALNMFLQTAAIELVRKRPELIVAAMQPGTVRSRLSAPFVGADQANDPLVAAQGLLCALDSLKANGRAYFVDYKGELIPW